jgi:dTDP-4-dehydrorhamnose 3,5-epimerase-like enzyme
MDGLMSVENCVLVELPKIIDARGNLTAIEGNKHVPFDIKRVYYLYDVPGGASRGGHAHKELKQLLIAVSGSFEVLLDDGFNKKNVVLNRAHMGLLVTEYVWRELHNFSSGSVCVVLASEVYKETDYFRDYDSFTSTVRARR